MKPFRRTLTLAAMAAALALAPAARAEQTVIRHVPQADLKVLDPVISQAFIVMQNAYLVYDQLFAWNSKGQPRPQMVDTWSLSSDQRTYTFTLRPGLKFHDGSPVRSADAIASIRRWSVKDPAGSKLPQLGMVLTVVDDRTFTLRLREPWGMTIAVMSKPSWALFVMPERDASNDANTPVTDNLGSGPFRFVRSEWVPGSKVVYERNPDYVPRAEPADAFSGGKVVHADRVEWVIMPDANTAAAALIKGEVDSLEAPSVDLLPELRKAANVRVEIHDHYGNVGMLRMNHLYPPFNNPKGREALLYMADQSDYMQVAVGDPALWRKCYAYLSCGAPESSEDGTADYHTPNLEKARELLKEAGYKGEKVVVMDATGINMVPQFGQVSIAAMRAIGLNVEVQTMEWSVMLARRLKTDPPDQGGWSVMHTYSPALDLLNPVAAYVLTAPCTKTGWPGWACDPELERLRDAYGHAVDGAKRKEIAEQIQLEAAKLVPIVMLGQFFQPVAYRTNLKGMLETPVPVMWNVQKE